MRYDLMPRCAIREAATGQELPTLTGHRGAVTHLAFSADGTQLTSLDSTGSVIFWAKCPGTDLTRSRDRGVWGQAGIRHQRL